VAEAAVAVEPPDQGHDGGRVGLEIELLPDASHDAVLAALAALVGGPLPGGAHITFEPGGQVELSGPCLPSVSDACRAMRVDLNVVRGALADARITVAAIGVHPGPSRGRVLDAPRYQAMEAYFDQLGPDGRTMMRDTAALQVNVDDKDDRRWRLVHALGPVLGAAFANSPVAGGRLTGWRSTRQAVWLALDPTRCAPVGGATSGAWVDYALAARVMLVRAESSRFEAVAGAMTFADWIEHGHPLGHPTEDDLHYHLTTLFPPVRPRGWLELRFYDALPSPWWQVAAAVTSALLDGDDTATAAAEAATVGQGTASLWCDSARHGLGHPVLADAALRCFRAAVPAIADPGLAALTVQYFNHYTARRRSPADDVAERYAGRFGDVDERVPAWG
jgi:glutamate--cysteine ligase